MWEFSVFPGQIFCKPKNALKEKSLKILKIKKLFFRKQTSVERYGSGHAVISHHGRAGRFE